MAKLGDYVKIRTGKLDANASSESGQYPFFTCAIEPLKIDSYSYDCECVLVAGNGDLNVKYYSGKFDAYQRTYIIESMDKTFLDVQYLYFFMDKYLETLRSQSIGGVIKYIKLGNLTEADIFIPSIERQRKIVQILRKSRKLISLRKQQLAKLDELVKARFVEMFGDLASPACPWKKEKIVNICADQDDIKCGPFGTQLSKDEYQSTGVTVWEIPQINSNFLLKPTHFITAEKALQLESYSIIPGDIAMSRKGNVGRCAVFPENLKNGIIHSDVLRIRIDKKRAVPTFMMHQLHNSNFIKHQIELVSSGAIMAGINVTKLKEIEVHLPPLTLQNEFAAFVERVDQQKQTVQQSLEKLELMRKALMQEYFG